MYVMKTYDIFWAAQNESYRNLIEGVSMIWINKRKKRLLRLPLHRPARMRIKKCTMTALAARQSGALNRVFWRASDLFIEFVYD